MTLALELQGIVKSFPGVIALNGVSLAVERGSIHALIGENGAGKSTLIKIITGVHRANEGTIKVDDRIVHFVNPRAASREGIGVVHQERNLIPRFSIAENIVLDRIAAKTFAPINYREINRLGEQWLRRLELDLDVRRPVSSLTAAQAQMVEIARALSLQSKVLVLDEPTASLTSHEAEALFRVLRQLRDQGVAILLVSHKLEEIESLCDCVTVLRDGRNATSSGPLAGYDRAALVRAMVGRDFALEQAARIGFTSTASNSVPALELDGVSTSLGHRDISLSVARGEIVGLYGLVGAGRTELAKSIIGLHPIVSGELRVHGRAVRIGDVNSAVHRYSLGYVSEDRKAEGVILMHSVLANAGITIWARLRGALRLLSDSRILSNVDPLLRRLDVKAASRHAAVRNLSGGNQQKVSIAKWLAAGVEILIIDEPSVGIDIRTKAYLHQLIMNLADQGTAILLISSDLPEMVALADRILLMKDFRLVSEIANDKDYTKISADIMSRIQAVAFD
ncbi:monosaccharide ABC transporter ATP-binding protein (CUT2 family) [Roseiarcus fermentans]|uniref:Monosaccharide ABC transporter ATP-binding protein (CUT2 family) n=1 Tax=Roseiarcus fermentans TaxID=1473586 RepID=A0A366EY43_9HYPH|nr:sugar ABC transporter ATP-binding protein [Roseiarcus fermentans]RBP07308.1 monosaccharide ABC transporter ATP-binding protein (CUT2 family) [Roseiarcus fermentans]